MIPLDGLLLWNRLIWIGVGCLLLTLSFTVFSARERRPRAPRVEAPAAKTSLVMLARPAIAAGGVSAWDQFVLRTRHETRSILRSWTFIVLLILGVVLAAGVLSIQVLVGAIPTPPVTLFVVNSITATFGLVTLLIPIAYGGELIWRDRKAKIAQIVDATPAPTVVFLASKIIATGLVILALLGVGMATGIVFQWMKGSESIDVAFYLIKLPLIVGLPALMYSMLAIFIQTVVNRKFVGLLIMLALLCVVGFAADFGLDNPLLTLFTIPDAELPGTQAYARFFLYSLWFAVYWTGIAVLVGVASYLLWVRGSGSLWTRMRLAHQAVTPAVAVIAAIAFVGTAATAGYIRWSEHSSTYSASPAVVAQNSAPAVR
jgi:ABC-2 type transport system permease protein